MINQKTYSFLIKFLVSIITFLGISLLVHSFIDTTESIPDSSIPYLSVPDATVDSLISLMSLDEKLDMLVKTADETIQDSMRTIAEYQSDSLIINDSLEHQEKKSQTFSPKFSILPNYNYLCAITDTSFLNNYFRNILNAKNSDKKYCDYFPLDSLFFEGLQDSTFALNYKNRVSLFQKVYHEHRQLLGCKMKRSAFAKLESTTDDTTIFSYKISNAIHHNIDFLLLDSVTPNDLPDQIQGILVAEFIPRLPVNGKIALKMLNAPINIYVFHEAEDKHFKSTIKHLINGNEFSEIYLNQKLRNILKAKIWQQTNDFHKDEEPVSLNLLNQQVVEKSICLLNNPDSLIPIKRIYGQSFYIVSIANLPNQTFFDFASKYAEIKQLQLKKGEKNWSQKLNYIQNRSFIIYVLDTALADTSDIQQLEMVKQGAKTSNCVFVNFNNYQNLKYIPDSLACIQAQSKSENDYKFAAQAIFGGMALEGQLPYTITDNYGFGQKINSNKTRLKYTIPEDADLDAEKLKQIEKIAYEGINGGAFPGCQVFVAKNGKVVLDKSFGYQTYSHENSVKENDVYDLASVTKIAATTIATMKMISDGRMGLNDKLGKFFKNTTIDYTRIKPDTVVNIDTFYRSTIENWNHFLAQNDTLNINDSSFITIDTIITKLTPSRNIFKVPLVDLLQHKSGIVPAMPVFRYMFYKAYYIKQLKEKLASIHGKTGPVFDYRSFELPASFPDNTNLPDTLKQRIKNGFKKQYDEYFSKIYNKDSASVRLTENLYLKNRYFDTIWRDTKQLPVFSRKVFQYSDVNLILLQLAIDTLNRKPIDEYLKKNIYNQLGLKTITYLPLRYYGKNKIIPTEWDNSWRYGNLHGYVHDPSAALIGGMAGNAGLYSNAHDLGILFQMVLNKGNYGGVQYLNPKVVDLFTKRHDDTQRGLGFDMPNRKAIVGTKASKKSFGHSGYTGTCLWVDPENEIVYVFLSNRNHPNPDNWRIIKYKIRERIYDAIYDAMIKKGEILPEENLLAEYNE